MMVDNVKRKVQAKIWHTCYQKVIMRNERIHISMWNDIWFRLHDAVRAEKNA